MFVLATTIIEGTLNEQTIPCFFGWLIEEEVLDIFCCYLWDWVRTFTHRVDRWQDTFHIHTVTLFLRGFICMNSHRNQEALT